MKKFTAMIVVGIIIVTLVLPTLSVMQALAQSEIVTTGRGANAFWPDAQIQIGEFTLSDIQLQIFPVSLEEGKQNQVDLSYDILRGDELFCSCSAGLTTNENIFRINGFDRATLSPITLDICVAFDFDFNCTESFPVTLQAEWKGFGSNVGQFTNKLQLHDLTFVIHGNDRNAAATGSLNDQNLGETTEAAIFNVVTVNNIKQ